MVPRRSSLRRFQGTCLGGMIMTFLVQAPLSAGGEEVATVLARMREAAGTKQFKSKTDDFLIQGKSSEFESAGEYRLRFTAAGKFLQTIDGPLGTTRGFNGTTCWRIDRSGVYRTVERFDRD